MKAMNMSDADIAARFMVSRRTVQRYVQRYVITGTVSPFQKCNGPVRMLTATEDTLISALLDRPSLYLHEMQQVLLQTHGINTSLSTISRHLGVTRKKAKQSPEQCNEVSRLQFMAEMCAFDPAMLIWLDETGCDKRNAVQICI